MKYVIHLKNKCEYEYEEDEEYEYKEDEEYADEDDVHYELL